MMPCRWHRHQCPTSWTIQGIVHTNTDVDRMKKCVYWERLRRPNVAKRLTVHFARPHQHQRSKLIDSSCCISVPFSKHHNTLNSIHKIFLGICTCRFELLWRFDVLISWVWYFAFCGISLLFFHRTFQFESRGPIFWRHRSTTTAICWWYIIVIYFFWISNFKCIYCGQYSSDTVGS